MLELIAEQGEDAAVVDGVDLNALLGTVFQNGERLVLAMIDQEFAEIPVATKAFKASHETLLKALTSLKEDSVADLENALAVMTQTSQRGMWFGLTLSMVLTGVMTVMAFVLLLAIIRPIRAVGANLKDVAQGEGDIARRLDDSRHDEIGVVSHWFNVFSEKLHRIVRNITGSSETLRFSAQLLAELSADMAGDVAQVATNSKTVKDDAEDLTTSISSVVTSMEETSENLSLIATASEEMSNTIDEISRSTEKARQVTGTAVDTSNQASQRIHQLGDAIATIGKITETITEISDQTNLLALNATIEASRAGEAGKGFAVVANEIKALALQTAEATRDIDTQIGQIQASANESVEKVKSIAEVIKDVDGIVSTIATAMEEQSSATREIAGNVSHASQGLGRVKDAMAGGSDRVASITEQINQIHARTSRMAFRGSQTHLGAEDLAGIAEQMDSLVGQFKLRTAKFDMGQVKGAHLRWRYKLHAMVNGHATLKPDEVASHTECEFGRWLLSPEAEAFSGEGVFATVQTAHQAIHASAKKIAQAVADGRHDAVAKLMDGFDSQREVFFQALDEFYQ